ncbi:MAG: hypothetical protein ACREVA_07945 [Burkholderiales bacterium]
MPEKINIKKLCLFIFLFGFNACSSEPLVEPESKHNALAKIKELHASYCSDQVEFAWLRPILITAIKIQAPIYPAEGICDPKFTQILDEIK